MRSSIFSVIKNNTVALVFGVMAITALVGITSPALVVAQEQAIIDLCEKAPDSPVCKDLEPPGSDPVSGDDGLFLRVFNALSFVAGVIAVIIIVVGGIQMMTSDGDPQKFTSARNLLIFAFVGIMIVFFAQAIVRLVVLSLIE